MSGQQVAAGVLLGDCLVSWGSVLPEPSCFAPCSEIEDLGALSHTPASKVFTCVWEPGDPETPTPASWGHSGATPCTFWAPIQGRVGSTPRVLGAWGGPGSRA